MPYGHEVIMKVPTASMKVAASLASQTSWGGEKTSIALGLGPKSPVKVVFPMYLQLPWLPFGLQGRPLGTHCCAPSSLSESTFSHVPVVDWPVGGCSTCIV